VVDADGKPLVVYHGTRSDIAAFDPSFVGKNFPTSKVGFYFSNSSVRAGIYADGIKNAIEQWRPGSKFGEPVKSGANIMPVYLSLKKFKQNTQTNDYIRKMSGQLARMSSASSYLSPGMAVPFPGESGSSASARYCRTPLCQTCMATRDQLACPDEFRTLILTFILSQLREATFYRVAATRRPPPPVCARRSLLHPSLFA
jgi:hypothetical protein